MVAHLHEEGVPYCPRCDSQDVWRNGTNCAGKQQWRCKSCRRVFVTQPHKPDWVKVVADRMISLEIPVPKISKVLEGYVSRRWVYERKKCLI